MLESKSSGVTLHVLGIVQDAGYPQMACKKDCCKGMEKGDWGKYVSCLGLIDHGNSKRYLFDATPNMVEQWDLLTTGDKDSLTQPSGIFLTHGHVGHYTGLMYLGRESMNANNVPVYVMPRMNSFLKKNAPWDQLVDLEQVQLRPMRADSVMQITNNLNVTPILVPHRDEYTETVGFIISGPNKKALFIPDIDKWGKWERDIISEIAKVDYAFLDGTFYSGDELPGRNMDEIPHPSVKESMELFKDMPYREKKKIHFIHFNHTNPLIWEGKEHYNVVKTGYGVTRIGQHFKL